MPFSSEKLLKMFGTEKISWQEVENVQVLVKTGHQINEASSFFKN
jgi:methionyl-tRNA synthetase